MVFFGFLIIIYKNLHIEPFDYTIKSVCCDFGSGYIASSVLKTGSKVSTRSTLFHRFRCHYPLITYLNQYLRKNWEPVLPNLPDCNLHWYVILTQISSKLFSFLGQFAVGQQPPLSTKFPNSQ